MKLKRNKFTIRNESIDGYHVNKTGHHHMVHIHRNCGASVVISYDMEDDGQREMYHSDIVVIEGVVR